MDQRKSLSIALMPIHPKFTNEILSGRKKVEFRRRNFAKDVGHVVIYATSPIKMIVAFFDVDDISTGTPNEIWERFHRVGGIEKKKFMAYYRGSATAVAIHIGKLEVLKTPIPLSTFSKDLKAPQSYSYFSNEHFKKLKHVEMVLSQKSSLRR